MNVLLISSNIGIMSNYLEKGKKIGFIPTASELEADRSYMINDYNKLNAMGYNLIDIDITKLERNEFKNLIDKIDSLYVAGGNTFYLLQQIKEKDVFDLILDFINSNKLYVGASAGAVILVNSLDIYKTVDDPKDAHLLKSYDSFNVIDFYPLPHYDMNYFKDEFDKIISNNKGKLKLVPFKNNQVIIVKSNKDYEILETD